jgi:hypothetical protein
MEYRWFYTSSGKKVLAGKNSRQNEELVDKMLRSGKNYIVMHTKTPGSPFCFLICNIDKVTPQDLYETAVFCGSFSQQWKTSKTAIVDSFLLQQMIKDDKMKEGTFGVVGPDKSTQHSVELRLIITRQNKKVRAVPPSAAEERFLTLTPGKLDKETTAEKIREMLIKKGLKVDKDDILQAIPAGGFSINDE